MAFEKGHKKLGGRTKDTPNRVNGDLRNRINRIIIDSWGQVADDIKVLEPKDRIQAIIKLLDFAVPKPNKTDLNASPRVDTLLNMSEVQRRNRIRELTTKIEDDDR